jgi:hypothetical protein
MEHLFDATRALMSCYQENHNIPFVWRASVPHPLQILIVEDQEMFDKQQ